MCRFERIQRAENCSGLKPCCLLCQGSDLLREAAGADVVEGDHIDIQRIGAAACDGTAVFG